MCRLGLREFEQQAQGHTAASEWLGSSSDVVCLTQGLALRSSLFGGCGKFTCCSRRPGCHHLGIAHTTTQCQSISPLLFLGPRGSPALHPTRIRKCLQGRGWAGAGLSPGRLDSLLPGRGPPHLPAPRAADTLPHQGPALSPTSIPLGSFSPLLGTQLTLTPQLLGS